MEIVISDIADYNVQKTAAKPHFNRLIKKTRLKILNVALLSNYVRKYNFMQIRPSTEYEINSEF